MSGGHAGRSDAAAQAGARNAERLQRMEALLRQALAPTALELRDDSHLHVGHAGARDGRGHFHVRVVSEAFAGKPLLARHRLVYAALGEMMQTDIHALSVEAAAPDEGGDQAGASN